MPVPRALSAWLPVLVWAAVIFTLSSIPSLSTGLGTWDTVLRKGAHMAEFMILGALLVHAVGSEAWAFAIGTAYAATDEVHQLFVRGRHGSVVDVLVDAIGVAIGVYAAHRLVRTRPVPGTGQGS
jgi:VanZ family protein